MEIPTMLNFFKNHGAFILLLLMFPVLWPVYAVYDLLHFTHVSYDDCREAWWIWIGGTVIYCAAFALMLPIYVLLQCIYQAALKLYTGGYLVYALLGLVVVIAIFIAPWILYCIFKIIKK